MRKTGYIISLMLMIFIGFTDIQAQTRRPSRRDSGPAYGKRIEKKITLPDSLTLARRDSLHKADSIHRADSISMLGKSSLEQPAFSNASDSMMEVFTDGARKIFYWGDVSVKYQDMALTAAYMEYDMNEGTVYAKGVYDSIEGEWTGRPVMTQGSNTYEMDEVKYNFNSRKARITNMKTTDDQGIIQGQNIKMMPDQSVNMTKGIYTVCDADHPHYYVKMSAARKDGKKMVFGPANLVVGDVSIPFIGLPFGFVPERPQRATGLLMPTFGEEEARGFYLRDLGMYFVFGDYFDLSLTGDYYTLGSWAVDLNSRYMVKYKFNGNLSLNYSYDRTGEKNTPEFFESTNFGVRWTHTQDSKSNPGSTFSASVNFQSPSNNRFNSHSVNEALQSQASSSISYSKNWNGKFNLSINALHSQNNRDSSYMFTLPNVTFSMSTIYPFKKKVRVGKEKFYEKFSIGYNTSLQNKIGFKASQFKDLSSNGNNLLDMFSNGMAHNFSIGLPNFQLLKYISINPGVSYSQNWFFKKTEYAYNPETDRPEPVESHAFNAFGITQNYSFSASASTRVYGTFNFRKGGKLQAIRHVMSPSISASFSPEKGTYANGYRTLNYIDKNGNEKSYDYNIYAGQIGSVPARGKSATASFSLGNNLEAKVRDYADTTGKGTKKIKLIDQLTLNTSYNFLADSLNLAPLNVSMSTNLFNKVNISASMSWNPYAIGKDNREINRFAIASGQGLLRMNTFSASASYSITGEGKINGNDGSKEASGAKGGADSYQRVYYHPVTGEFIPEGWLYYTNPSAPWSINLSASFSMRRQYTFNREMDKLTHKDNITASLNASGNIRLTPKMNINISSGYDFVAKQITTTQISATYDLHCFNISVSWVPMGTWKSYSFRIAANASALADLLKFRKSDSYWDN